MRRVITAAARYAGKGTSVSFWHTEVAPVIYDFASLNDYYIDLTAKTRYQGPRDPAGIIVLDYRGSIGRQYNPCAIAQLALGHFARWKRGSEGDREPFRRLAVWLRDAHAAGRWNYQFDLDCYGAKAPWTSALAQGQGISVLLRAHREWTREGFREAADLAYKHMAAPVEEGGLCRVENGMTFLEEVVANRLTGILDGWIFAVFGLQDYVFVTGNTAAGTLLRDSVDTMERRIADFDLGFWSRADLYWEEPKMIASLFYHRLHVAQLKVLAELTGRQIFAHYARKWERAAERRWNRLRALAQKVWFKLRYY